MFLSTFNKHSHFINGEHPEVRGGLFRSVWYLVLEFLVKRSQQLGVKRGLSRSRVEKKASGTDFWLYFQKALRWQWPTGERQTFSTMLFERNKPSSNASFLENWFTAHFLRTCATACSDYRPRPRLHTTTAYLKCRYIRKKNNNKVSWDIRGN